MAKITENGIEIERLDALVDKVDTGFRKIYGQNINTAADSPDGQMIGIIAQMLMDNEELLALAYKQLDPDLASGIWLEQRAAYAGLVRRQAKYSYLPEVILTGEPHALITQGVIVSDPNKVRWVLTQDVQLNEQGSAQVDFRSEELGAFNLPAHTVLTIETVRFGLESATSQVTADMGTEEETDVELRQRFFLSRSRNAVNSVDALEGKLLTLPDVRQVSILENNKNTTDKDQVPPHSINVIVLGGDNEQIAEVIYQNKGAGVGLKGNITVDLLRAGKRRSIKFDRASYVDIAVQMIAVRDKDFTEIDQGQVKAALANLNFNIGDPVNISRLYTPINTVGGFWVQELKIGRRGRALSSNNLSLSALEVARILPDNIQIEVR